VCFLIGNAGNRKTFTTKDTKSTKEENNNLPNFVSFVPFVVNRSLQVSNQEGTHWTSASLKNSNT
jgi:hypothetical protein